jgi:hypothetical protein
MSVTANWGSTRNFSASVDSDLLGSGGPTLDAVTDTWTGFLDALSSGVTNESSFGVSDGLIASFGNTRYLGAVSALSVEKKDSGKEPLDTTIEVESDQGGTVAVSDPSHRPITSIKPPANLLAGGQNPQTRTLTTLVSPGSGVSQSQTVDATGISEFGLLEYAAVPTKVETQDGSGVAQDTIIGDGFTATTNGVGRTKITAPLGNSFDVTLFEGTYTDSVTATAGQDLLTFVYPRLTVQVFGPNFKPMEGASVLINGALYETNATGEAVVPKIGVTDLEIEVQGYYKTTDSIPSGDYDKTIRLAPDSLADWSVPGGGSPASVSTLDLLVRDDDTLTPIRNARVSILGSDAQDNTTRDGRVSLMVPGPSQIDDPEAPDGKIRFQVGSTGDGRYIPVTYEMDHPGGSAVEDEVTLSPTATVTDR